MSDRAPHHGAESAERSPRSPLSEEIGEQVEEHVRRTRLAGLFLQSPSFMAVTRGPEHVFVNANPAYREMVGDRELIGRSAREAFPDLAGQGFLELLDRVYETGETHVGSEEPARLRRGEDDGPGTVWVSYSYHSLRDGDGDVSGILHHGVDVTERVELRRRLERRVRQRAVVAELGRSALETRSLADLNREVVEAALQALDADAVALLRDRGGGEPELVETAGDRGGGPEAALRAAGRACLDGRAVVERGRAVEGGSEPGERWLTAAVPVPAGDGSPPAALVARTRDGASFGEQDVPVLRAIARTAGAALARHEERRFRETVARNLPGLLYRCRNDRAWTMEYLSRGTEELTGFRPAEITGDEGPAYVELIHPEDRETVWRKVQEAVGEGRPFHLQYRIRTREGETRWVWEQGRGVEPATGESSVLEGYVFDVTEWREAKREAGRLEAVLQAAFRGTREALFVVRLPEREIVECNPGAEELFGYSRQEMLGRRTDILHVDAEHRGGFGRRSERELRREGYYRAEFEMRRKGGEVFPTDHSVTHVDGEHEPPGYAVSIVRDISGRKERKARLERSRLLLQEYAAHLTEARERERAEIAREVHDELGQELTGLKFHLERLHEMTDDAPQAREACARGLELLGSVFDSVRELSESLRPPHLESLGLRRTLAQLVERWEEGSGLAADFRYRGPDDALGGDRDIHVYRVVQEALTNVARHAEADRVRVEVRLEDGTWTVRVRDDGVGIEPGDSDAAEGHGLLGMRERAWLLGGELRVLEADPGGTEVLLEVPAGREVGDG